MEVNKINGMGKVDTQILTVLNFSKMEIQHNTNIMIITLKLRDSRYRQYHDKPTIKLAMVNEGDS